MSPAGGGAGGGLDSPIASTIFSIPCITPLIFFNTSSSVSSAFGFSRIVFVFLFHPLDPPPAGDSCLPRFRWVLCRCVSHERHGQTKFVHPTQPNRLTYLCPLSPSVRRTVGGIRISQRSFD